MNLRHPLLLALALAGLGLWVVLLVVAGCWALSWLEAHPLGRPGAQAGVLALLALTTCWVWWEFGPRRGRP
jgi:membrane protein implicated in regulation of membrane protease activity